jgi:autotransporter-associated beta strand protein
MINFLKNIFAVQKLKFSILFSLALLFFSNTGHSATYYSKAAGTGIANTVTNWNTLANGTGSDLGAFTAADVYIIQAGHTMALNATWGSLAYTVTVNSGGTLDLNGNTLSSTLAALNAAGTGVASAGAITNGSATLATCQEPVVLSASGTVKATSGDITFTGGFTGLGFTLTTDGANNFIFSTAGINLSTNGVYVQNCTGTVTISAACSYTGTCTINSGTFKINTTTNAFGTSASTTSVATGAKIDLNGIANSTVEAITINGNGGGSGVITNSSATLGSLASTLTLGADAEVETTSGAITLSGTIALSTFTLTVDGASASVFSGVISGSGGLTKTGAGALTLGGAANNTYTGATAVNQGSILLGRVTGVFGTLASTTTVSGTGSINLNGIAYTTVEPTIINASGGGIGAITNGSATLGTYAGTITLGSDSEIESTSGNITLSGTIATAGFTLTVDGTNTTTLTGIISGTGAVIKNGSGIYVSTGVHTYSGLTTISVGTLKLGASSAVNTGGPLGTTGAGTIVSSGGALDFAGFSFTGTEIEAITLSGTGVASAGAMLTSTGSSTCIAPITLAANASILSSGTALTISGGITTAGFYVTLSGSGTIAVSTAAITGSGGIVKSGAGVTTFSFASTYTGTTTVTAGTLLNGAANLFPNTGLILNGGTYSTGSGVGYAETFTTLTLSSSSTINFGTGAHVLNFSNSSGETWVGTLTITGWTGSINSSGTAGQLFIGTTSAGLGASQLLQLAYTGFNGSGVHVASGEFAPTSFNYYVASTGNNALDGLTLGNAKLTLQAIFTAYNLMAGDVINISAGTYTDKTIIVGADDEGFVIQGAALSSGVPTTIFDSDQTDYWLKFANANNDNITIDKIKIKDYKNSGSVDGGGIWVSVDGVTGMTITSSYFENCDSHSGTYGGGAIYFMMNGTNATLNLTDVTFTGCDVTGAGGAIYIYDVGVSSAMTMTMTRCKMYSNSAYTGGSAMVLRGSTGTNVTMTNCQLYSNNIVSGGNHGVIYTYVGNLLTMKNCTVYGNTTSTPASDIGGLYVAGVTTLYNTILYNNSKSDFSDVGSGIATTLTNCCYGTVTADTKTNCLASTNPYVTSSSDMHLLVSSTCIDAGTTGNSPPSDDYDLATRSGNPDIGCFEYFCTASYAGTYEVGTTGTWTTLTDAIAALKRCMTDDVILELQSNYVSGGWEAAETYPLDFTRMPTSATVTLTIRPKSDVLSVFTLDGSSTTTLVLFDGTNYVTFDGRLGGAGTASYLTIENTSTATGGSAIKFVNDATNNTIKYCTLKSNFTSSTWGVVWFSTSTGSTGNDDNSITYCTIDGTAGATASPTSGVAQNGIYSLGTTGLTNSGNSITYNEFKDMYIDGNGASYITSMMFLDGFNDSWTISNNSFYQTNTRTSTGTNVVGFEMINIDDGDGYVISSNYFGGSSASATGTWTITQASTSRTNFYGIDLAVGTTTATSIQGNIFKNITWGFYAGMDNFAFIYSSAGKVNIGTTTGNQIGATTGNSSIQLIRSNTSTTPDIYGIKITSISTVNIQNNIIGAISTSNAATVGYAFYGIFTSGAAGIFTVSSNVIGSTSTSSSISIGGSSTAGGVCEFYGITNSATGLTILNSNTIQNCNVYGTGASIIECIVNSGSATNSTINSNTIVSISNATIGTSTTAYTMGIKNTAVTAIDISSNLITTITVNNGTLSAILDNASATGTHTITYNTIGSTSSNDINIVSATGNSSEGINCSGTGTYTITGNKIQNYTSSGAATNLLMMIYGGSTGTYNMSKNTIKNIAITNTGAYSSAVYCIYFLGACSSSLIEKNRMTEFSNAQVSAQAFGIYSGGAGTMLMYNNVITSTNAGNVNDIIFFGIYTGSNAALVTIYHNTISIGGSPTSGSTYSGCLYYAGVTANKIVACRNNIFQNVRTNSGTASGLHSCYYVSTATAMTASACNNNFYYAPVDAKFAYAAGAYRTAAQFNVNTQGYGGTASKYSLSITVTQATGVVPGATTADVLDQGYDLFTGGTVTQDKDDNARDAAPWIGAFESITALPIKLIYFSGEKEGRNNKLSWGTESEINNDYFTIEKTINGSDFTVVGMENGAGTSTQFLQYEMMDNNVEKVINYYRLLQTDFDGKYTVSDLISIDNREGNSATGEIVMKTNILGQEVNEFYKGLVIIVYSNGTSVKVIQ